MKKELIWALSFMMGKNGAVLGSGIDMPMTVGMSCGLLTC